MIFGSVRPSDPAYSSLLPSLGYVVYDSARDPSPNSFWYKIKREGELEAENMLSQSLQGREDSFGEVGQYLLNLGKQELKKEIFVLNQVFGNELKNVNDILTEENGLKNFIKDLTILLRGKDTWIYTHDRLKKALEEGAKDEKGQMAAYISSTFIGKFQTIFSQKLNNLLRGDNSEFWTAFVEKNFQPVMDIIKENFDRSVEEAFFKSIETFDQKNVKGLFGDKREYKIIQEEVAKLKSQREEMSGFFDRLKSKMSLDKILESLAENSQTIIDNITKNKLNNTRLKTGMSKAIGQGIASFRYTPGGTVYEELTKLLYNAVINTNIINGGAEVRLGAGEIQKTDIMAVINLSIPNFGEEVFESFQEFNSKHYKNLIEAAEKISKFTKEVISKANDTFIIYSSAKAYGFGKNYRGLENDKNRAIEQLPDVLSNTGVAADKAKKLINLARNAIKGAVLADRASEVKDAIRLELARAMAFLLFDDWDSFTDNFKGSNRVIHVFSITGLEIPLSVLLIKAGQSLINSQNTRGWFSSEIRISGKITYDATDPAEKFEQYAPHANNHWHNEDVLRGWNQQRVDAEGLITFTTKFFTGIKTLYNQLLAD